MRWILHVDMNSYFASVEQQSNPKLRGKPIGIGGKPGTRSVIAAASIEAKARGVKTAMSSWDAIKICPELQIVTPDYKKYQYYSEKMFGILESFTPNLEIFSIDESFLDISEQLAGLTDEQVVTKISAIVREIKARFREELGPRITSTTGVGHGKRLAKLAGEMQKPDGFVVLLDDNEQGLRSYFRSHGALAFTRGELYAQTDVEELCGIGPRLGRRLRAAGVHTLAQLASCSLEKLETIVFPYHKELYLVGQGRDPAPVTSYRRAKKEQSIGHMYTMPRDLPVVDLPPTLSYLVEKVGRRMRRAGFVAHRVNLYLRRSDRSSWGSYHRTSQQLESDRDLYKVVWQIIDQALADPGSGLLPHTLIRMPSITASELVPTASAQQPGLNSEKADLKLTEALDKIRERYGDRSISSALSSKTKLHQIPDGRRKRFNPHDLTPSGEMIVHSQWH